MLPRFRFNHLITKSFTTPRFRTVQPFFLWIHQSGTRRRNRQTAPPRNLEILYWDDQILVYIVWHSQQDMVSDFSQKSTMVHGPYPEFGPVRVLVHDPNFWTNICWSRLESGRLGGTDFIPSVIMRIFF